jgi:hypothetical protein
MASEPVATTELTTADAASQRSTLPAVALVASGLALALVVGVAALAVVRRGSS